LQRVGADAEMLFDFALQRFPRREHRLQGHVGWSARKRYPQS
jgi:hypothetical protein